MRVIKSYLGHGVAPDRNNQLLVDRPVQDSAYSHESTCIKKSWIIPVTDRSRYRDCNSVQFLLG